MAQNKKKEDNWFLPLILLILLAILIVLLFIIREFKQKPYVPASESKKTDISIPLPSEEKRQEKKFAEKKEAKKQQERKIFPLRGKPKVALIIDDVGWNREIIREIEKINQPFTLAILPKAQHSREIVESLKGNDTFDLLLHLPLEPAPPAQSFDKGLLTTGMKEEELLKDLKDNLDYYRPYIKGVNNHMGSLFTTDREKMKIILGEMKDRGLFFVDSMTSRKSCGYLMAKDMGIRTGKRDVFIDNESDHKYIEKQIWQLVDAARENGSAIGIGHARKDTVAVLKRIMPSLSKEVDIVPVSSLLE